MSQVRVNALVDKEDMDWFKQTYPADSHSWLFTMLLKEFRKIHSMTPADYAAIGAKELRKAVSGI